MNVSNIKIRGALEALNDAAKSRMHAIARHLKEHEYEPLNTLKFETFVENLHALVLDLETLRLEYEATVPKTEPQKTDVTGTSPL